MPLIPDWNTLLEGCHRDDPVAREHLFAGLRVRLLTIAQYRLRGISVGTLEDLVQGTLEVVVERIGTIESNPHLYALQILRNKIGDHLRTRSRRHEQTLNPTDWEDSDQPGTTEGLTLADPDAAGFETRVEKQEIVDRIRHAIGKLSPICKALFLALLEGRAINEVWELAAAADTRLTRSTFDKRLFDCRKRLRALVGDVI